MVIKLTNVNLAINNWYFQGEENRSNTEAKVWALRPPDLVIVKWEMMCYSITEQLSVQLRLQFETKLRLRNTEINKSYSAAVFSKEGSDLQNQSSSYNWDSHEQLSLHKLILRLRKLNFHLTRLTQYTPTRSGDKITRIARKGVPTIISIAI